MAKEKTDVTKTMEEVQQPKTHQEDPFLNLVEVGKQLGKHHSTIRRWIDDGLIVATWSPCGYPTVRKSEVNRLLQGTPIVARIE